MGHKVLALSAPNVRLDGTFKMNTLFKSAR